MLTSKIIRRFLATSGGAVRATKEWPPVNEENDGPQRANEGANGALVDFFAAAAAFPRIGRSSQAGRTTDIFPPEREILRTFEVGKGQFLFIF